MKKIDKVSNRILEAMRMCGMKQADLVEATGISKSSLSQYLSDKYEPKSDKIVLIAKALGVSETWLLGYDVPQKNYNLNEIEEFMKNSPESLSVDQQKAISMSNEFSEIVNLLIMALLNKDISQTQRELIGRAINSSKDMDIKLIHMILAFNSLNNEDQAYIQKTLDLLTKKVDTEKDNKE